MESPNSTLKNFWGIRYRDRTSLISVITNDYYQWLQTTARPDFYKHFEFLQFSSPLTFTELNSQLPLRIDGDQVLPLARNYVSPAEYAHIRAHQDILLVYKKLNLEPFPPWEHFRRGSAGQEELLQLSSELAESAHLYEREQIGLA